MRKGAGTGERGSGSKKETMRMKTMITSMMTTMKGMRRTMKKKMEMRTMKAKGNESSGTRNEKEDNARRSKGTSGRRE
jgi:predicted double-glycine peptidase